MPIQQLGTRWLLFADGALWVAAGSGLVLKVDPVENRILHSTRLEGFLSDLAVDGGFLWLAKVPDGILYKLSGDDLSDLGSVPSGPDPERISTGAGSLRIANTAAKAITLIQEDSGTRRQLASGAEPMTAYHHDGLVWAAAAPAPSPLPPISGQELRIAAGGVGIDPATAGLSDEQVFYATCAKLLNYPDTAGAAGGRLRPEIAAAMPAVSRDERTYTFRIRTGFRFSPPSNEPVTAETFRHSIERVLSPKRVYGPAWPLLPDIEGMSAYRAGKAAHVSGIAAHGDTLSITLVKPAGDFLTRLSMDDFCPVPLGEPVPPPSGPGHPIPSAGPYYVSSLESNRVVLERNPNYRGNRRAAALASSTPWTSRARRRPLSLIAARLTTCHRIGTTTPCSYPAACSSAGTALRAPPLEPEGSATSSTRSRPSTPSSSTRGDHSSAIRVCAGRSPLRSTAPRSRSPPPRRSRRSRRRGQSTRPRRGPTSRRTGSGPTRARGKP
jgi:Bacterial extracellular solute-binding proteins, family 5 Middle